MTTNLSNIWQVMEEVHGDPDALERLLGEATAEQLIYVRGRYRALAQELVARGASEQAAKAAVGLGRYGWRDAKQAPPRDPPPGFRDLEPVFATVYQRRFGGAIPDREPDVTAPPPHTAEGERALWNMIEFLNIGIDYREALEGCTRSELVKLGCEAEHAARELCSRLEPVFGASPPDIEWYEWTDWVISQGEAVYRRCLANPESAPRAVPDDAARWLARIAEVYDDRYDAEMPVC